tara:strand:+ start:327 stop:572 length:246 start_codon:yes stop_codon:yes gene_type:complete
MQENLINVSQWRTPQWLNPSRWLPFCLLPACCFGFLLIQTMTTEEAAFASPSWFRFESATTSAELRVLSKLLKIYCLLAGH